MEQEKKGSQDSTVGIMYIDLKLLEDNVYSCAFTCL